MTEIPDGEFWESVYGRQHAPQQFGWQGDQREKKRVTRLRSVLEYVRMIGPQGGISSLLMDVCLGFLLSDRISRTLSLIFVL